jgi:hypothetical protein
MRWCLRSLNSSSPKLLAMAATVLLLVALSPAKTRHLVNKKPSRLNGSNVHKSVRQNAGRKISGKRGRRTTARNWRSRGQHTIDSGRAQEIQAALIREGYLEGQPSGLWDQRTKDAMARFQGANGWQTKMLPDSRALIKLGLGPNHANLITVPSGPMPQDTEAGRFPQPGGSSLPQ